MSTVNFEEEVARKSTETVSKTDLLFKYLNHFSESKTTGNYDDEELFKILSLAVDLFKGKKSTKEEREAFIALLPDGDYPFLRDHKDIDLICNRAKSDIKSLDEEFDMESQAVKGYKLWNSNS